MTRYKILYGLEEEMIVDTSDQMNIFTAGLILKGSSYSIERIDDTFDECSEEIWIASCKQDDAYREYLESGGSLPPDVWGETIYKEV